MATYGALIDTDVPIVAGSPASSCEMVWAPIAVWALPVGNSSAACALLSATSCAVLISIAPGKVRSTLPANATGGGLVDVAGGLPSTSVAIPER